MRALASMLRTTVGFEKSVAGSSSVENVPLPSPAPRRTLPLAKQLSSRTLAARRISPPPYGRVMPMSDSFHDDLLRRLAETEARYRSLRATSQRLTSCQHDAVFEFDPQLRVVEASPGCEHLLGHPAQAFKADPDLLLRLLHPDYRAEMCIRDRYCPTIRFLRFLPPTSPMDARWCT